MTDQEILNEIQYHLLEDPDDGANYLSEMWTVDEVSSYLNARQNRFLTETGIVVSRTALVTIPSTPRHDLPDDWVKTRRVVWRTPANAYISVTKMTWQEADNGYMDWQYNTSATHPKGYIEPENLTPALEIHIVPAVQTTGQLNIWYVALGTELSNTGVAFTIPDECVATIKWGVLADMLSKPSRAQDLERAQYCEMRFQEGIELTNLMFLREIR